MVHCRRILLVQELLRNYYGQDGISGLLSKLSSWISNSWSLRRLNGVLEMSHVGYL